METRSKILFKNVNQQGILRKLLYIAVNFLISIFCLAGTINLLAQSEHKQISHFNGEKTKWYGFDRYDFVMDEQNLTFTTIKAPEQEKSGIGSPLKGTRRCIVVVPEKAAPGNPWSWRGCYWDHQPQAEIELLKRGFHIVYISANQFLRPGKEWDAWYDFLTLKYGLSPKPAFIGMSLGGEFSYIWATSHPDKVTCIYADNTAVNWDIMKGLAGLAINDVPLLHICGSIDPLFGKNSLVIENVYQQFGGRISTMIKEGFGHHPHSLRDPGMIADFIEQSFYKTKVTPPEFAGVKSIRKSFYDITGTINMVTAEGAYITCRGPFFTECYNRYEIELANVQPFITIIAPETTAPGKPWIFRSDYVRWDAAVDLALLAKGFHIVTGAVPYGTDGPDPAQWDTIYKYLIRYGFSRKPVMEGSGGGTGEVYAWAVKNPDKVSCIFGVNPLLHSNMAKTQPIDNLAPLAKAGVAILHICSRKNPWFDGNTGVAEKRYKKLGGKITVIMKDSDEQNYLITREDLKTVVDFIISRSD
jgi:pimeloyl-ACP methyl ester carboxylesterase